MVRSIDNIVTAAPLRDIRLSIGPAEALLRGPDDVTDLELQEEVQEQFSESFPVNEEELNERERQGYERGREESVAQYEEQIQALRTELDQKNSNELPEMLGKIESQVSGELNQRLNELETELVEFATPNGCFVERRGWRTRCGRSVAARPWRS